MSHLLFEFRIGIPSEDYEESPELLKVLEEVTLDIRDLLISKFPKYAGPVGNVIVSPTTESQRTAVNAAIELSSNAPGTLH